tara:strand:- start:355 stop:696 length:342 start_codon:yes stop_codon:yes gene_type:complete
MPDATKPNGGGSNSESRKATITDVMQSLAGLEAQRKSLGEQIREIKQIKIKGELGMKIGDFNIAMRLYALEGEARDELLDTVRETFEALGVGEQLDWIAASNRAGSSAGGAPV